MPMNHVAPSHIHTLSTDAVYAALHSGPDGLGTAQAQRRLTEFGPNRLQAPVRRRRWRELLASFTHFFALVLWLAAALAFGLGWRDPGSGLAALGYAIVAVIVLNGLFSYWQAYQAERAIAAVLDDPLAARQRASAARARVLEHFDWVAITSRYAALMQRLIGQAKQLPVAW